MDKSIFNMHTMYGHCPEEVVARNIKYAFSTFTSSTDTEAERIQRELIDFLCTNICKISSKESLVLNSGSEANEIALFLSKRRTSRRTVVASNFAHSSISYAARKLDMHVESFIADPTTYQIKQDDLISYLTEHGDEVAMLNVTYGTTQLGTKEEFILAKEIQVLCRDKGIWLHVDAAFGAFYLHTLGEMPEEWQSVFNFADSITIDPYKFVGLPTSGILMLKDVSYKKLLDDEVTYFKGTTTALGTTRSVLPAATSLELFQTMGVAALRKLSEESLEKARYITNELQKSGAQFLTRNSNVVVIKADDEASLDAKLDTLYRSGFYLSSVKIETPHYRAYGMRIVTTPKKEMTLNNIKTFVDTFKKLSLA